MEIHPPKLDIWMDAREDSSTDRSEIKKQQGNQASMFALHACLQVLSGVFQLWGCLKVFIKWRHSTPYMHGLVNFCGPLTSPFKKRKCKLHLYHLIIRPILSLWEESTKNWCTRFDKEKPHLKCFVELIIPLLTFNSIPFKLLGSRTIELHHLTFLRYNNLL